MGTTGPPLDSCRICAEWSFRSEIALCRPTARPLELAYLPIQDGPDPPRDGAVWFNRRQRERMAAHHVVAPADGEEAEFGATSIS